MVFLVDEEIARRLGLVLLLFLLLRREQRRHLVHAVVDLGAVLGLAGNDQRRARLVDEDGVHLVDDAVDELALEALLDAHRHVVAQVVEAELVVGAVGDVGLVSLALVVGLHLRDVDAHREAEEVVDLAHPLGVALGQVIVDGDDVHAGAGQRIQVGRQRRHQRLALAGAHLRDLAVVQHHAADQLHVEVAHAQRALGSLAHHREGLGQQLLQLRAVGQPLAEFGGLAAQRAVGELGDLGLERVDALDRPRVMLQQPLIATAEDFLGKAE